MRVFISDTGSLKLGQSKYEDDDDAGSAIAPPAVPLVPMRPIYEGPLPTPPQKAFQPGSTPTHLTHRFMVGHTDSVYCWNKIFVFKMGTACYILTQCQNISQMWNSVGIVRGYNDEQDNAIDVEFHDSAVHHAMHLTNSLGHTLADLSQEAVLLACPSTEELARYASFYSARVLLSR